MTETTTTLPPADLKTRQKQERERIDRATRIEREWWQTKIVLHDKEAKEQLIPVPDQGRHYRLIGPIRRREEPNLARPETIDFLRLVQEQWQSKLKEQGLPIENIWFAITSLYRNQEFQNYLTETHPRAPEGLSAHQAGVAIDFDAGGYWQGETIQPVNQSHPHFDPRYLQILEQTLEKLAKARKCNFVPEKGYRLNDENKIEEYTACYHVCLNPNAN